MAINGCLTLAWLEEDDPSRGFFRVQPAAVMAFAPQVYIHGGEYGSEGFLRVVPDKNEMSTFKLRMRTLGRLCLIDLREHPRENDKIRQNKNFTLGSDRNPFMIYSDVIRGVPEGLVCEVIAGSEISEIITPIVYKLDGGQICGPYRAENGVWNEAPAFARRNEAEYAEKLIEIADPQGASKRLLVFAPDDISELVLAPISDFVEERGSEGAHDAPVTEADSAPSDAAPPAAAEDEVPDAPKAALPYALKILKENMNLHPHRGRSLSEVVDEQWRMRKQEELGQSVPPLAASEPVASPVDKALAALSEAWQFAGARAPLIKGLIDQTEIMKRLFEIWSPEEHSAPTDARLIELEAERLRLITELDGLARRTHEMKSEVLRELERTGEADAELLRNSLVLLQTQIDEKQNQLQELAEQGRALEDEISKALGKPLTERIAAQLAGTRLGELIAVKPVAEGPLPAVSGEGLSAEGAAPDATPPQGKLLAPDALTDRISLGLRAQGWQFKRDYIVHIAAVLALDRPLIISGFAGQDDVCLSHALCGILGDDSLALCGRINDGAALPLSARRAIYSVLDHPYGEPVNAAQLDAGFLMRPMAELCLPQAMPEMPPVDPASYAAFTRDELSEAAGEKLTALAARLSEFGANISHSAFCDCARYVAAASGQLSGGEDMAIDYAMASRMLPAVLVSASGELIRALPDIIADMPECMGIMRAVLPVDR